MFIEKKRTPEELEKVISILKDKSPRYKIEWDPFFNPEIAKEFSSTRKDYNLSFWGYNSASFFKKDFGEILDEWIFHLKKQKSLNKISGDYIQSIIEEFSIALSTFEQIKLRSVEFQFQPEAQIYFMEGPGAVISRSIESIEEEYFQDIYKTSQLKYDFTIKAISELNKIISLGISSNTETKSVVKLETSLSVSDIALLFRLLDEAKIINYKHKTEIYRYIASTMKTSKQDNISEASIKNKFLSPDNTAIKNLNILLTNLKIVLNKLD